MKKLESGILLASLPIWICCLCCDGDKPVDMGIVQTTPCPEAAAPYREEPTDAGHDAGAQTVEPPHPHTPP
jgi:hypothetical protein